MAATIHREGAHPCSLLWPCHRFPGGTGSGSLHALYSLFRCLLWSKFCWLLLLPVLWRERSG